MVGVYSGEKTPFVGLWTRNRSGVFAPGVGLFPELHGGPGYYLLDVSCVVTKIELNTRTITLT